MIEITKDPFGDTRTCNVGEVSKEQLIASSENHIRDVRKGMEFFIQRLQMAADLHDLDKIEDIDNFYRDFKTNFETTEWWDTHRVINRHHLQSPDGVPVDVNLLDVLECVADCVMAGMSRSEDGTVRPVELSNELLSVALANTVSLLQGETKIVSENE